MLLHYKGSEVFVLNPFEVVFGPILPARIVHEVARVEELAERRPRVTAPITPGWKSKSNARGTYLPPEAS